MNMMKEEEKRLVLALGGRRALSLRVLENRNSNIDRIGWSEWL